MAQICDKYLFIWYRSIFLFHFFPLSLYLRYPVRDSSTFYPFQRQIWKWNRGNSWHFVSFFLLCPCVVIYYFLFFSIYVAPGKEIDVYIEWNDSVFWKDCFVQVFFHSFTILFLLRTESQKKKYSQNDWKGEKNWLTWMLNR